MAVQFPSAAWCDEATVRLAQCVYDGPSGSVAVTLSGTPQGVDRYAVVFVAGSAPTYRAGAMPEADASFEQPWADAVAHLAGTYDPAVGFMQGQLKTKGSTRPLFELFQWWARAEVREALAGIGAASSA